MADNTIEIGFNVGNDDLKTGLDKAVQDFNATCAAIQQTISGIAANAQQATPQLISFQQAYSASARFLTTIADLYGTLINETQG